MVYAWRKCGLNLDDYLRFQADFVLPGINLPRLAIVIYTAMGTQQL